MIWWLLAFALADPSPQFLSFPAGCAFEYSVGAMTPERVTLRNVLALLQCGQKKKKKKKKKTEEEEEEEEQEK